VSERERHHWHSTYQITNTDFDEHSRRNLLSLAVPNIDNMEEVDWVIDYTPVRFDLA